MRRGSGVTMNSRQRRKIAKAISLYRRFSGHEPEYITARTLPTTDVAMLIGKCDGVLYTTVRDGRTEHYIHEFSGKSRPLLVSSWDGKQLYLLGGAYNFTADGIVDRK